MNKIIGLILFISFQLVFAEINSTKDIRIVSTANVHGETDPCG
tara:strand:+ start:940 stop:1068 length:129 start_codon:yes stop_codon:yes gene_type:complete